MAFFANGARADTTPASGIPATVSADALPTTQINGVVWSQATVGNTVYATGKFTQARPAGAAPGTQVTTRSNLLAYDITTGKLLGFNHGLNAQGIVVAASPDHSRIYVGGDFTSVSGVSHGRIAAFDTATGALISSFTTAINARVKAIAATASTVYVGGSFTAVNGTARSGLAAVNASNGSLLPWAPSATGGSVAAMVLAPSGKEVIVGGQFTGLNGKATPGLGAVSTASGALVPWAANQKVHDSGVSSGITSLRTDGSQVYGTGFAFGAGNLEGAFAADPDTGAIHWIEDCHGDSYDTFAAGSVLYLVSHAHYCANIGGFPDNTVGTWHRATAFTTYPTGTIAHNASHNGVTYADWFGNPSPTLLDWYPTLVAGTFTGQNQAAWSATGNANYLALGGEFPTVNGVGQQGLVRFSVKALAPNKVGPTSLPTPTVTSPSPGTARITWPTAWDQDNQALTYLVVRDGNASLPVHTQVANSTFWQRPTLSFTDTGLVTGSTHSYKIYVRDPLGNLRVGGTVSLPIH
jgi:hypothetical protein